MLALGQEALDLALAHYSNAATRPIFPPKSDDPQWPAQIQAGLNEPLPRAGQPALAVLEAFRQQVLPACRNNSHPRMNGYVVSAGTWVGAIGDWLASAINQNVTAWRSAPGPTVVERLVMQWIAEILDFPSDAAGLLVSGGSMANFIALAAALRAALGTEINQEGLASAKQPLAFYASSRTHLSIAKGLSMLGVGTRALRIMLPELTD